MTPQLAAWKGDFGNDYIGRNETTADNIRSLTAMWAKMLSGIRPCNVLEVGANVGLNLRALRNLSSAKLTAVEPNELARHRLVCDGVAEAFDGDACHLPFEDEAFDLSFTAGVLIHIAPNHLPDACREIVRVSSRYVLCAEYYSAAPREVNYRGNGMMLWTRDFGQLYRDTCPELKLRDYGFFWTGAGAIDNLTWWLWEK